MSQHTDQDIGHSAIEFRNVTKTFDGKTALRDVSFTLGRGETIIITGGAGSGKSTLLHLGIGLVGPDCGSILIDGAEITSLAEVELAHKRSGNIGLVFQEEALFTALTTYENTAYRLREAGWKDSDVDKAVMEILEFVGLQTDIGKLPEELSVGMKRRLEVARALVGWPRVMLYDEPTGGLDPINNKQVLNLVIRARDIHHISSLYVTKEQHEIPYLAHHVAGKTDGAVTVQPTASPLSSVRVMVLDQGEVAFLGSLADFEK
ncbi:MAG TPA: ATP-binding cassette domain-containing protein, partial [Blastocatellia bacterium]|nr:ATP-binding cassette domain-containing protein [Blastocatellia bacterium]